jgi:hypothetical protein
MGHCEWKSRCPDRRIAAMTPFQALLLEGTSGVGKSTLVDALIRRHVASSEPRKIRTLVHLAQSHTYGPLALPEDDGTLTVDANLRHLERIVGTVEWLHAGRARARAPVVFCARRYLAPDPLRSPWRGEVERRRTVRSTACCSRMQAALSRGNARDDLGAWNQTQGGPAVHSRVREEIWSNSRGDPQPFRSRTGSTCRVIFVFCHNEAVTTKRRNTR